MTGGTRRLCGFVLLLLATIPASAETPLERQKRTNAKYAIWQIHAGHHAAAIRVARKTLESHPKNLEALFALAVAHAGQGEVETAMGYVRRAVDAGLPFERFLAGPRELLAPLVSSAPFRAYAEGRRVELLHGPMLGAVTSTSARFWVRTAAEVPVRIRVRPLAGEPVTSTPVSTRAGRDYTAVIEVTGLAPDTRHAYDVLIRGEPVALEPPPAFRTAPRSGAGTSFHVAFGACASYRPGKERVWDTILAREPRALLLLGDNSYFNVPDVAAHQRYFFYRRQSRPEFRRLVASTPLYAIWDDHDFGGNDSIGGPSPDEPAWKRDVTLRVFAENFANPYFGGGAAQPGVWTDFSIGDVDFFLLDGRYYRTDPRESPRSMLGPVQKRWLFEKLRASRATFKIIASPVPFASGTKSGMQHSVSLGEVPGRLDTWDGFPEEREELFRLIERERIEGVFLISGDRHRSDAWKIRREGGYDLYEAISAHLTKAGRTAAPAALFSHSGRPMFGLLAFHLEQPDPELHYTVIDIDGQRVDGLVVKHSQLRFEP